MSLTLITAPAAEPLTVAEVKRQLRLGSSAGEPAPTVPTAALINPAAAGNCDNGAWRIGFTHVTADGETELGPLSAAVTVVDKTVNGKLAITNVALGGSAVTARNAYALSPGASVAKYAGQIANNTATTYTLNIAASALGAEAPTTNTTNDPEVTRLITAVRERAELATNRSLITQTWDLVLDGFPPYASVSYGLSLGTRLLSGYDRSGGTMRVNFIEIPKAPLQSITHVKYYDTTGTLQTWAASNYVVEAPSGPRAARGRLGLAYGIVWPSTYGQQGDVTIRFVCGYGAASSSVPAFIRSMMLLDASDLYVNRGDGSVDAAAQERLRRMYWSYRSHPTQRLAAA